MANFNPKSLKAEEFIHDGEIQETLAYAEANKDNLELIDEILEKARPQKTETGYICAGLSHREASVLLACDLPDKIEKIYWAMKEAIETNFPQAKFIAHFSHWYEWGSMIYDRFIVEGDNVPKDPVEALRLHQEIWTCGVRAALANGGVVNDHHGVGIKLGRLMKEQYGSAMQVFEGIKKSLDPNGIMNPFKLGL